MTADQADVLIWLVTVGACVVVLALGFIAGQQR